MSVSLFHSKKEKDNLNLNNLKSVKTREEFAKLLGYKPKALAYILYHLPATERYREIEIPKKNGGKRLIFAPCDRLKLLQSRLASLLNGCYEEIFDPKKYKHSLAHGFRKNHSIITNAQSHVNRRHVFNIDLKDFFPSINFGRIQGFFIKDKHFELSKNIATIIAQIACHESKLPQGSPCSPVISNFICCSLDFKLVKLAKKVKCHYSRYADDITFSTNKKEFPKEIAVQLEESDNLWKVGKKLESEILRSGFEINEKKTSLQTSNSRQLATGLVVNEKLNVKKEYYKLAGAMCSSLFMKGHFQIEPKTNLEKVEGKEKIPGTIKQLEGILGYIYQIKRISDDKSFGEKLYKPKGFIRLYQRLLFYKYFFALKKPLILCEGKTDIVYLKCAMKNLRDKLGSFTTVEGDKLKFSISFLKLNQHLLDVLSLAEGSSGLKSLLDIYESRISYFKSSGKKFPVIILLDDDSGSEEVKKKLNSIKPIENNSRFIHFRENLYIVFVPVQAGEKESAIEDLFEKTVLTEKINNKSFSRKNDFNTDKEYGKQIFAEKIIKAKQSSINFNGFVPLLEKFQQVIDHYAKKNSIP